MEYIPLSFIAGVLTVLAPCVFTLLPVILGGSLVGNNWKKTATIIGSLAVSVFFFTLILKASTLLIYVDPNFWKYVSGGILIGFGIVTLFPKLWGKLAFKLNLSSKPDKLLSKGSQKRSFIGDVLVGAALGPVFSSCSPTYAIIIATILPQDPISGVINLIVYIIGLTLVLALISIFGQKIIKNLKWAVNPNGAFKKLLGIIFIVIGISIFTGFDKKFEIFLLDNGLFNPTQIETKLLEREDESDKVGALDLNVKKPFKAPELAGIVDWINSSPLKLAELKGKVVLVDFWTYSCINCIRTLPYLTSWYDKYKDDGLVIIGVHSPEFAFEKVKSNVENAVTENKVKYPVALDNNFSTWKAYENQYWPASYFIDRNGNIVHTHFGEGAYVENEMIIQQLLSVEGKGTLPDKKSTFNRSQTPETYLGYSRIENFLNLGELEINKAKSYTKQRSVGNYWSLEGDWSLSLEYAIAQNDLGKLSMKFNAREVYLVMGSDVGKSINIKVFQEDKEISSTDIAILNYGLYTVVKSPEFLTDYRLEITNAKGVQMHAFTFGG